jgi:hypothetical protein
VIYISQPVSFALPRTYVHFGVPYAQRVPSPRTGYACVLSPKCDHACGSTYPPRSTVLEEFPEGRILLQLVDACIAQRLQQWGDAGAAQVGVFMFTRDLKHSPTVAGRK